MVNERHFEENRSEMPRGFRAAVVFALNEYAKTLPEGQRVSVLIAGGAAVNYWCHSRYTEDIDAEFSPSFQRPTKSFVYIDDKGEMDEVAFDPKYNPMISFLNEGYQDDACPADFLYDLDDRLDVKVMLPVDIAVSKLSRFSDKDLDDIATLAIQDFFTIDDFKKRATDALVYQIGNNEGQLKYNLNLACKRIEERLDSLQNGFAEKAESEPKRTHKP